MTAAGPSGRAKFGAAVAVAAVSLGAVGVWATSAGAAVADVPTFPNNLAVFPDRDFVSIEGYTEYANQDALVEVTRPGVGVVGSATGTVTGTDVAFEVNHPGGYCWGAGGGLPVTPDIVPGDVVSITFPDGVTEATTVQDAQASDAVQDTVDPRIVTVTGHIGAGIDPLNFEQRIIEPALRDLVGKRDVRALPGPPARDANDTYTSGVEITGTTFVATYVFDDPAAATIAANAGLGERAMTWEVTDAVGNRQGLTIAEFGEAGGPGMGGCPNGPLQSGPPAPGNVVAARSIDGTSIDVAWTPATAIAGTQPILGYRVTAVDQNVSGNEQIEIGRRIGDPLATATTITGLDPSRQYDVQIVSMSSVGETFPVAHAVFDVVAPSITASPTGGTYFQPQAVTLTADEPGVDIWYTVDGSDPVDQGTELVGATALPYTGAIAIGATTTLKFAGFDRSGNLSDTSTEQYDISTTPTAGQTVITLADPTAPGEVTVTWSPATVDVGSVLSYRVRAYLSSGTSNVAVEATVPGTELSTTLAGLLADTDYWVTVAANSTENPVYGPESDPRTPVHTMGLTANAGPDQSGMNRATVVNLTGTGSAGATYQWTQVDANGNPLLLAVDLVTIDNANSPNASFTLPFFSFGMTNGPLYFKLTVSDGLSPNATDTVKITPRSDTITVASARWKAGDFRVSGAGLIDGAVVTIRSATGQVYGTAVVTAGAFNLRLRNGAAPAVRPAVIYVDSNMGGTTGPVTVN